MFSSRSATLRRRRITLELVAPEVEGTPSDPDTATFPVGVPEAPDAPQPAESDPSLAAVSTGPSPEMSASPEEETHCKAAPLPRKGPPNPSQEYAVSEPEWERLAELVSGRKPIVWVFAGTRPEDLGDESFLLGEQFGRRWRAASGRQTDVVIDSTCPGTSLAHLRTNLTERVLQFRPDVAFLGIGGLDAEKGMPHLSKFERQLDAVISRLQHERIRPVLLTVPTDADADGMEIDRQIYSEAVVSIAKERDVMVVCEASLDQPEELASRLCDGLWTAAIAAGECGQASAASR